MATAREAIMVMFSFVSGALAWAVICAIFKQEDEA